VYLMFVVITWLWPQPKNLAQLIALCAAVLIGIQFWYADGGVYVLWYLPLLLLLVFRPNLSDRMAPPDPDKEDFVSRIALATRGAASGLIRRLMPQTRGMSNAPPMTHQ